MSSEPNTKDDHSNSDRNRNNPELPVIGHTSKPSVEEAETKKPQHESDKDVELVLENVKLVFDWFRSHWPGRPDVWMAWGTWAAVIAAVTYAGIAACQLRGISEASRINHASLVATQRAYVSVIGLNIEQSTFNPKLVSYIVSPIVVNSGNTPTKHLWYTAVWRTRPVTVEQQSTQQDIANATRNYGTLGARQEVKDLIKQPIPAEDANVLRQSYADKHIPIYGAFVYEDGISDPPVIHVRRYCYSLYVNPYFTSPVGLSYVACGGRSNCEDQECDAETQKEMKKIMQTPN